MIKRCSLAFFLAVLVVWGRFLLLISSSQNVKCNFAPTFQRIQVEMPGEEADRLLSQTGAACPRPRPIPCYFEDAWRRYFIVYSTIDGKEYITGKAADYVVPFPRVTYQ